MGKGRRPPSIWKRFRYRLEGLFLELLAALVPLLSRKMLVRIANAAGWVAFHLMTRERRIGLTNLDIAFGPGKSAEEKQRIVRSAFQTFARSFLGLFWARRLNPGMIDTLVDMDTKSRQLIEECRARGKGIIFVTLHYGEWELIGLTTAMWQFPMTIVTEQINNPHLARVFERLRGRTGSRIILQWSAMPKLFKALKRGECIALLIDLNAVPNRGGIWLDFFGKPVFSYSAVAALASRTGAAIVPGIAHPLPDGRIRPVFGPEISCASTGDAEADVRTTSQDCLNYCEDTIRQHPEHWLWLYRRWQFRPTAEQGDYPYYSRCIKEVLRPARVRAMNQNPKADILPPGNP